MRQSASCTLANSPVGDRPQAPNKRYLLRSSAPSELRCSVFRGARRAAPDTLGSAPWPHPTSDTATLDEISFWSSHFWHLSIWNKYLGKRGRRKPFPHFRCAKKEIENSDIQSSFSRRMTTKKYFIQQLVFAALLGPGGPPVLGLPRR